MTDARTRMSALRIGALLTTAVVASALLFAAPANAHSHRSFREQRDHVESRGRSVRGTRYRYGGSSPRTGFDCSGFTRWVYKEHGADLPHSSMDQFRLGSRDRNKRVWKRSNLERGDLVFFKTTRARVGHAGIYIGDGKFIHSSSSGGGVRIDSVWDRYYYGPRFVGATRLPVTMRFTP
ncbi:MAG: C40 family peptidase [Actinomycetota bacterium]